MKRLSLALAFCLGLTSFAQADDPPPKGQGIGVPYRRTDTQHILVRAKINGKGPYNFILDTGAPIMFVSTAVGKKLGLESDNGWAILNRLDIEGGVVMDKVRCRVETPFQLEGMNGMGLAGAELHGILGYTILARYKMDIDFTRDKMIWTLLDFQPPPPQGIGGKGGSQAGLELIGSLMKLIGFLSGTKTIPEPAPRGFLGLELGEKDQAVTIQAVLQESPAQQAGLKTGDSILEINGLTIRSIDEARRQTAQTTAGQPIRLLIRRGTTQQEFRLSTGEGL
jgi:hypothetical protein